jgi:alpha-methylacyl-CoA racemase
MMTYQPLSGIRILDLSRLLPGPYLTQLLADLGAEVIKIETPGIGDYARFAPPEMGLGGLFEAVNQAKKSVALNYRNPDGRKVLLKLAASADVLLEGFKPGSVKKWGIDYEAVREMKPDIVYCSLSGYGQAGPYRDRPGHDLNYLALSGALQLNARQGESPIPYSLPAADLSGSMLAAIAILGALIGRAGSGQGAYLDMALFDGVMSWMGPLAGGAFSQGLEVTPGSHPFMGGRPYYSVYKTSDGNYLSLAAIEPTFWSNFCMVANRPDLIGRQFDNKIGSDLEAIFLGRTRTEWLKAFEQTDVCVEPVNSFDEMLVDPQVQARGFFRQENGRAQGLDSPFVFARRESTGAPKLGEHTRVILREIGIEDAQIEDLLERRVIATS